MHQSMEWIELKRSSPVQIHEPLILIQSNPAEDPEYESSPVRSGQNRVIIDQIPCRRVNTNDDVYSWRFEGRTSDIRVTIRRNYLKSLNMGYTLHISGSSPIQNPLSWWISDPVQSKSAWTGLDYGSSGLIQSIPYSGMHISFLVFKLGTFTWTLTPGHFKLNIWLSSFPVFFCLISGQLKINYRIV